MRSAHKKREEVKNQKVKKSKKREVKGRSSVSPKRAQIRASKIRHCLELIGQSDMISKVSLLKCPITFK